MRNLTALRSVPVRESPEDSSDLVTELVAGECVEVVGATGESDGFLEVLVPGHPTRLDSRGYPGWARTGVFGEGSGWSPTHRIVSKNRAGLPLGARLRAESGGLYSSDGERVEIEENTVLPLGEPDPRKPLEVAREFEGLPYRWGGADSTEGADCSGLVYRVMEALGVRVPRDADDQFERAPMKSSESWREARKEDLVFFGGEGITHVGLYLGDGIYLSEHGSGGTLVRGIEEDPYRGFARYLRVSRLN